MNRLLNSGKFWLKALFFGLLATLSVCLCLYVSAYHFFNPQRIQHFADNALENTGRSVYFDAVSGRNWFPRPTVTLKNLTVTRRGSKQTAVSVKETRIGLAWQSLWSGRPVIEKWTADGAEATIERTSDGHWSLQDLWQQNRHAAINRLIIRGSTVRVRLMQNEYLIRNFNLDARAPESGGRQFNIGGILQHPLMPLDWQGGGRLQAVGSNWRIPSFHLDAQGRLKEETLKIRAESALEWQPQKSMLAAHDTTLRADTSYRHLHVTTRIPLLALYTDRLNIKTLHSVFTAQSAAGQWNGSLEIDQADLHPQAAALGGFILNASHKDGSRQTDLSVSGPLGWQKNGSLKSEKLHIATQQNTPQAGGRPRFSALLEGSLEIRQGGWQGRFQGFFDRQRTALKLKYHTRPEQIPLLEAGIALQKLAVEPYWEDMQARFDRVYPAFLNSDAFPEIKAQINIGGVTLPGMRLDGVETLLAADRNHIALTNFKAGLYGGRTEGGISMANTSPVSYHLQQNAQSVQIRPLLQDLFGFHSFSGTGDAVIDLKAKGSDRKSLLQSLNGSLNLNVSDGVWHGIDINNILQSGRVGKSMVESLQTPFDRFILSSVIDNGISRHSDAELSTRRIRVLSSGYTDLGKRELSEELLIYNRLNPLSRPIPLKIKGSIQNPSVTLDYARLTDGLQTPQEKRRALENTLREQWQWLLPERK